MSDANPVYVILHIEITDPDTFRRYQRGAMATITEYGGRVLAAGPGTHIEGDPFPEHNVIVEFPSAQVLDEWYQSDAYQKLIPLRHAASKGCSSAHIPAVPAGVGSR